MRRTLQKPDVVLCFSCTFMKFLLGIRNLNDDNISTFYLEIFTTENIFNPAK